MNFINPSDNNKISCVNCQAVTTNDGRTVWVCEQCGTENAAPTPDATDAQAVIADAAAAAGAPIGDLTVSPMTYVPEEEPQTSVPPEPVVPPAPSAVPPPPPAINPDAVSDMQVVQPDQQ